ncbi:MAG: YlmH/Sll1252 family protein [Oscillospiraceae bacterium]
MVKSETDKLLADRVEDFILAATLRYQSKCTFFLDEREQAYCAKIAEKNGFHKYSLFGGYENSQRRVFGVFDELTQPDENSFGITPITCTFADFRTIAHRDFLGSLMGLGIKRECVGDILVGDGYAIIFVINSILPVVMSELRKVSTMGVKLEQGITKPLPAAYKLQPLEGTVSSLRLDCITAMLTGQSREKSTKLIASGLVFVNYVEQTNISAVLKEKDVITIRGEGKFIFDSVRYETKKGKLNILINKFV